MTSSLVSFLIIVCMCQFILIMKLLSMRSHNHTQEDFDPQVVLDMSQSEKTIDLFRAIDQSVSNSTEVIAGVAVTVMLHTPKWYQRRYSMMIQNVLNNVPPDWKVQIFYTGKGQSQAGLDINPAIARYVEQGKVILTLMPEKYTKIKKYQLMLTPWMWENMLADKVLFFGGGSAICSNSLYRLEDFLDYDWIGAPWGFKRGIGGEGGISVRSRKLMLRALEYELDKTTDKNIEKAIEKWGQEDNFYVKTLLEMKEKNLVEFNIAPASETYKFAAVGSYANETVWAASGTLPDVAFDVRDQFLSYCPELKLVYPSLHDPNCFGADPKGEECAKNICALKVPRRKGGC